MTFQEAIPKFLNYIRVVRAEGTYHYYLSHSNTILRFLKDYEVEHMTMDTCLAFVDYQRSRNPKLKNNTINKYMITIKGIYKFVTNRSLHFPKLKESVPVTSIVPEHTYYAILKHLESKLHLKTNLRNYVFIRLLRDTGARLNEMLHMELSNVNLHDNAIYLEVTKNHEARYVLFTRETAKYLNDYIRQCEIKGRLFVDFTTGMPMSKSAVQNMLYKLRTHLGIKEKITPHKWRHTFATQYMRSSGNTEMLRLFLGHKSHKTVQRYIHYNRQDIFKAYRAYEQDLKNASNFNGNMVVRTSSLNK